MTTGRSIGHTGVGPSRRSFRSLLGAAAASLLLATCSGGPPAPVDAVALVDGEPVSVHDFELFISQHTDSESPEIEDHVLSQLFDQFLDEHLLLRLAEDSGFVAAPGRQLDKRSAITFLVESAPPFVPDETSMQAFYDQSGDRYRRDEEVHLRQILVHDRAMAEAAHEALELGEDFAAVAARFSQGPRAQDAGDQGWLSRTDIPPAFVEGIFDLAPGEHSGVVEADYGFLIFQVVAIEAAKTIPLTEVMGEVQQELMRRHLDALVEEFFRQARQRYNVEVLQFNLPFEYQGLHAKKESP